METNLLPYLTFADTENVRNTIYLGPAHWIENTASFPSVSAILDESRHETGISVLPEHQTALDDAWFQSLHQCFAKHADPNVTQELTDYLATGHSNGRKLKLQIMILPPGLYFKVHAHPNIEFEVTLTGCLEEFRWLFRVPADELAGSDTPAGPDIAATHPFQHYQVPAGSCMLNETGSVHQSFTSRESLCCILVMWSGCHANTHPSRIWHKDPRLKPTAGWEDEGQQQEEP